MKIFYLFVIITFFGVGQLVEASPSQKPWEKCKDNACVLRKFQPEAELQVKQFTAGLDQMINDLETLGWTEFYGFPLAKLKATNIVVQFNPPNIKTQTGARHTAMWQRFGNGAKVTINYNEWMSIPEFNRPFMAMHEILGGLYLRDRNYVFSALALWLIKSRVTPQNFPDGVPEWLVDKRQKSFIVASTEGGSTGVGGGGDNLELEIKAQILTQLDHFMMLATKSGHTVSRHQVIQNTLYLELFLGNYSDIEKVKLELLEDSGYPKFPNNPGSEFMLYMQRRYAQQSPRDAVVSYFAAVLSISH